MLSERFKLITIFLLIMKWYVAARRSEKETVKSLLNILKEHGHQITYDWTELEKIKPYKKNIEICKNIAYDI